MTTELLKAWYIFSFSLGFCTCLSLGFSRHIDRQIKLITCLFVLALLIPITNTYLIHVFDHPIFILTKLSQNLTLLYGPLLLLTIKLSLRKKVTNKAIILHLLPFIFINLERQLGAPLTSDKIIHISIISAQVFAYISYTLYTLIKHRSRVLVLIKGHRNTSYFWLLFLAIGLLLTTFIDMIVASLLFMGLLSSFHTLTAVVCIMSAYVNIIALFTLYQPDVFTQNSDNKPEITATDKIRNVELTPEAAEELDTQLLALVETYHPHLDESISLTKLASLLGVTRNQLSELFNVYKEISFYDFLNGLRHQESLKLLNDHHAHLTIADIAYQAGFNNRNSFYKVFKQKEGMTPSEFRKRIRNNIAI